MNANDLNEFAAILNGLASMYNRREPSDFVKQVWIQALMPYSIGAVRKAFSDHVTNPDNGQFMPNPADIIRLLEGSTEDRAFLAWTKFDKALRSVGTYQDVVFDDPIIHATVADMGGWLAFETKTNDEWPFIRNEFLSRYRGCLLRKETAKYPSALAGRYTTENVYRGYRQSNPVLIGDIEKARLVMERGSTDGRLLQVSRYLLQ